MSRFTFAKGNAEKVIALPVYALGALASLAVPRRRGHWAFGCGSGIGEGALALYREAEESDPSLVMHWMARNASDLAVAASLGIPAVHQSSLRGFWLTLRAEVLVVTHGFGDVNRFGTRGGFIVQLWHGIPLKLIHLDSPATMRSPILPNSRLVRAVLQRLYRGASRSINLMPAASPAAAARLRTAFALPPSRIVVTGDPRDDVLSRGTAGERRDRARTLVAERVGNIGGAGRLIMFAPTWRDGAADPGIPTPAQWAHIAAYLDSTSSILLVRPHPLSVGEYGGGPAASDRVRLLTPAMQPDVMPVLPAIDVLITDYSSIAFDYSLTGGDILYIAPDREAYSASRGLYENYEDFSGGREVDTWGELLAQLERLDSDAGFRDELREHTRMLAERHFSYRDGRNAARVFAETVSRLEATP